MASASSRPEPAGAVGFHKAAAPAHRTGTPLGHTPFASVAEASRQDEGFSTIAPMNAVWASHTVGGSLVFETTWVLQPFSGTFSMNKAFDKLEPLGVCTFTSAMRLSRLASNSCGFRACQSLPGRSGTTRTHSESSGQGADSSCECPASLHTHRCCQQGCNPWAYCVPQFCLATVIVFETRRRIFDQVNDELVCMHRAPLLNPLQALLGQVKLGRGAVTACP